MRARALHTLLRAALVVALAACAVLFVDYRQAVGALCGAGGGCAKVRASAYSHLLGVPLPTWGLGALAGLLTLAIWASCPGHWRLIAVVCALAAAGALALIGLQIFAIGAICPWCMVVDGSVVVAAAVALLGWRAGPDREPVRLRMAWGVVAVVALALPLLVRGPPGAAPLPEKLARLQRPDTVDIITFTDFECPYCRQIHPVIEEIQHAHPGRIRLVRLMVPLAFHIHAKPAALAYLCAPPDKQAAFADRLYSADRAALDGPGLRAIATELGLDSAAYRACVADGRATRRLAEHGRLFQEAKLRGLPATFVESRLIEGADEGALRGAVEAELGHGGWGGRWLLGVAALLLLVVAAVGLVQARRFELRASELPPGDG